MKEEIIWVTKKGRKIPISKLEDSHLLNIKNYIERRAKEGIEVIFNFGYCGDDDFPTGDIEIYYGKEARDLMNYKDILLEIGIRKLKDPRYCLACKGVVGDEHDCDNCAFCGTEPL